jgi:hypothetical protein
MKAELPHPLPPHHPFFRITFEDVEGGAAAPGDPGCWPPTNVFKARRRFVVVVQRGFLEGLQVEKVVLGPHLTAARAHQ